MSDLIGGISARSALIGVQERGSNTNGEYIKYKDGFMICTVKDITSNSSAAVTWTFPHAFASGSEPTVAGTSGSNETRWDVPGSNNAVTNTSWSFGCANVGGSVGSSVGLGWSTSDQNLSAIGRWY